MLALDPSFAAHVKSQKKKTSKTSQKPKEPKPVDGLKKDRAGLRVASVKAVNGA